MWLQRQEFQVTGNEHVAVYMSVSPVQFCNWWRPSWLNVLYIVPLLIVATWMLSNINQFLTFLPNCDMSTNIKHHTKYGKKRKMWEESFRKILLMIHTYCQVEFITQSTQKWWFKGTECELYSVYGGIYEGFRLLGTGRRILIDTARPLCLLSVVLAAYSVQLLHTLLYRFHTHVFFLLYYV